MKEEENNFVGVNVGLNRTGTTFLTLTFVPLNTLFGVFLLFLLIFVYVYYSYTVINSSNLREK